MAISQDAIVHDLHEHERRLGDVEDKMSETRKVVIGVDKTMAVMAHRLALIEKLLYLLIIGVLAEVGNNIWHNLWGR